MRRNKGKNKPDPKEYHNKEKKIKMPLEFARRWVGGWRTQRRVQRKIANTAQGWGKVF